MLTRLRTGAGFRTFAQIYCWFQDLFSFSVLAPVRKKFGDEAVASVLLVASKDPESSVKRDIAETLLTLLKMEWIQEGKTVQAIVAYFKALNDRLKKVYPD